MQLPHYLFVMLLMLRYSVLSYNFIETYKESKVPSESIGTIMWWGIYFIIINFLLLFPDILRLKNVGIANTTMECPCPWNALKKTESTGVPPDNEWAGKGKQQHLLMKTL